MKTWIPTSLLLFLMTACGGSDKPNSTVLDEGPVRPEPSQDEMVDDVETPEEAMDKQIAAEEAAADAMTQVSEGKQVWEDSCAMCHGDTGAGKKKTPGVIGEKTLTDYPDAGALMSFIAKEMPKDDPGSLEEGKAAAVTAWILSSREIELKEPIHDANAGAIKLR